MGAAERFEGGRQFLVVLQVPLSCQWDGFSVQGAILGTGNGGSGDVMPV